MKNVFILLVLALFSCNNGIIKGSNWTLYENNQTLLLEDRLLTVNSFWERENSFLVYYNDHKNMVVLYKDSVYQIIQKKPIPKNWYKRK